MKNIFRFLHPKPKNFIIPIIGMVLFILFYVIAALKYPGGSWSFPNQNGFSFSNNYLCDLLDNYAINGEINTARHYARASLGFLCVGIIFIWFYLPYLFKSKGINLFVMWITGMLSLIITLFLASGTHDIILRIAGAFGAMALISSFIEFYKGKFYKILFFGILCFIIFILNYYMYETGWNIERLPMIQKITFGSFIVCFIILDIVLFNKSKN